MVFSHFLIKVDVVLKIYCKPGYPKIELIEPVKMAYSDRLTDQKRLHKLGRKVNLEKWVIFGTEDREATHGQSDKLHGRYGRSFTEY